VDTKKRRMLRRFFRITVRDYFLLAITSSATAFGTIA
jgi:hypothetical protein